MRSRIVLSQICSEVGWAAEESPTLNGGEIKVSSASSRTINVGLPFSAQPTIGAG